MKTRSLRIRLGAELRRRRELFGLTQVKLAGLAGVKANAVSRLERGVGSPPLLTVIAISHALNLPVGPLIRMVDNPPVAKVRTVTSR